MPSAHRTRTDGERESRPPLVLPLSVRSEVLLVGLQGLEVVRSAESEQQWKDASEPIHGRARSASRSRRVLLEEPVLVAMLEG